MAGEAAEVSSIGVRLSLDASNFKAGMEAASGSLAALQKEAATATGQMKAGGTSMAADVTLSVNKSSLAAVRKQVTEALQNIPVTIKVQQPGRSSGLVLPMSAVVGSQYGMSPQVSRNTVTTALERRFGGLEGKAGGGRVGANRALLVGERTAEVFVPKTAGYIEPSVRDFYRKQEDVRRQEMIIVLAQARAQQAHDSQIQHALSGRRVAPLPPGTSMPPAFGTAPLREGYVRGFHMTKPSAGASAAQNLAAIRQQGLRMSKAIGHTYGEPNANWFSGVSHMDEYTRNAYAVEAHLPLKWFDGNRSIGSLEPGRTGVGAVYRDVSRRRFASYNEPWMHTTRYMEDDERSPGKIMRTIGSTIASMRGDPRYADTAMGYDQFVANAWRARKLRGMAGGGLMRGAGYSPGLRKIAQEYNRMVGLPRMQEQTLHPLDLDFSRRTALAYEAMPVTSAGSRRAYSAFADETMAQYRFLQSKGFDFVSSMSDPYQATASRTKMQLAAQDVSQNKRLLAYGGALEHPFLTPEQNLAFRQVHDMMGHLTEGFSIGPRGEYNAAVKHSQMFSPLARRAMLAETHGQNSVVNFSPTAAPGFGGLSIGEVNKQMPGTIYAQQKASVLPDDILAEFYERTGIRHGGGRVCARCGGGHVTARHAAAGRVDVSGYEGNLRGFFEDANPRQFEEGLDWYRKWGSRLHQEAGRLSLEPKLLTSVAAALSPNNGWPGNFYDAVKYAEAYSAGSPMPKASTFATNQMKAWRILIDQSTEHLQGLKVTPFGAALLGDPFSRPQDIWMKRAGTGNLLLPRSKGAPTPRERAELDRVTDAIAMEASIEPRQAQAIIWTVARDRGMEMAKMSRHARMRQGGGEVSAFEARAHRMFGITEDPMQAGWLGPSGKYLDFYSGGSGDYQQRLRAQQGHSYYPTTPSRDIAHTAARHIFGPQQYSEGVYARMMDQGFLRMGGFNKAVFEGQMSTALTGRQRSRLLADLKDFDVEQMFLDLNSPGSGIGKGHFNSLLAYDRGSAAQIFEQANRFAGMDWSKLPERAGYWERMGASFGKRAVGGPGSTKGLYIVGEIGEELFVPDHMAGLIPKRVMDQIPKARGGMQVIGKRRDHDLGGELFAPPEDGVIIPNRLMDQIPHAAEGRDARGRFVAGNQWQFNAPQRGSNLAMPPVTGGGPPPGALATTARTPGLSPADEQMFADLERGLITAGQATSTRTPQGLVAALSSTFFGGGRARDVERVAQQRTATRELKAVQSTLVAEDLDEYRAALDKVVTTRGEEQEAAKKTVTSLEDGNKQLVKWRDAQEKLSKTQQAGLPGLGAGLLQLGKVVAGIQVYTALLQGVGLGMAAATPAAAKLIDGLSGFTGQSQATTTALAAQTREQNGNTTATMNMWRAQQNLGGGLGDVIQNVLSPEAATKAGAAVAGNIEQGIEAAIGAQSRSKSPSGVYGGFGGIFDSPYFAELMGGGKGALEQLAGAGYKLTPKPFVPNQNVSDPVRDLIGGGPKWSMDTTLIPGTDFKLPKWGEPLPEGAAPNFGRDDFERQLFGELGKTMNDAIGRGRTSTALKGAGLATLPEGVHFLSTEDKEVLNLAREVAPSQELRDLVDQGLVLVNNGKIANAENQKKAAVTLAAGLGMQDPGTWAKEQARQLGAQSVGAAQLEQRQFDVAQPFAMWQRITQQPLISPGAGFFGPGGRAPGVGGRYSGLLGQARGYQGDIRDLAAEGLMEQRRSIREANLPTLPGQESALTQFNTATTEATGLSEAIKGMTESMLDAQRVASNASWANQIRIAERSLGDALGMLGRAGGTRLGFLQREEFLTSRASQQLGLQSQSISLVQQGLSLALQARQIATNLAVAQFQAPGETGEERYARQREAIIRAGIEKRQLGLGQQQYGISQEQFGLSQKQFVIAGQIWSINAHRAAVDAAKAIGVMQAARNAEAKTVASQAAIAGAQEKMGIFLQRAAAIAARAEGKHATAIQTTVQGVIALGQAAETVADALYAAVGMKQPKGKRPQMAGGFEGFGNDDGPRRASGYLGTHSTATSAIFGEAGTETVAILRNPRMGMLSMGGGGGTSVVNIQINNPRVRNDDDIDHLAHKVARQVEAALSRKSQMLGHRRPSY